MYARQKLYMDIFLHPEKYQWKERNRTEKGCSYTRPLGIAEARYYYDALFHGTSDLIASATFRTRNTPEGRAILHPDRIRKAWGLCGSFFPLIEAQIKIENDHPQFVVDEIGVRDMTNREGLEIKKRKSKNDVEELREQYINCVDGNRLLSDERLTKLTILVGDESTADKDGWLTHDIVFASCHCISDSASTLSIARAFFEFLAGIEMTDIVGDLPNIRERLDRVPAIETLYPQLKNGSVAAKRWRWAICRVLYDIEKSKVQGGHTFKIDETINLDPKPALSRNIFKKFDAKTSVAIIKNMKSRTITDGKIKAMKFQDVFPVLAQVAFTRVLCRMRKDGEIDDESWLWRLHQPTHFGGPFNLRRFMDPAWVEAGGRMEVVLALGFKPVCLPPIPRAKDYMDRTRVPKYLELLSRNRFGDRCLLCKQETHKMITDFVMLEKATFQQIDFWHHYKSLAAEEDARMQGKELPENERPKMKSRAFGGGWQTMNKNQKADRVTGTIATSTMGKYDELMPTFFPYEGELKDIAEYTTAPDSALLEIVDGRPGLRCRPGERYLTSYMYRNEIHFGLYFDGNMCEENVWEETLDEVMKAARVYLLDEDE